jgi:hypothetical protein
VRKSYLGYAREIPSSDGVKYEFENTFLSQVSKGLLDLVVEINPNLDLGFSRVLFL